MRVTWRTEWPQWLIIAAMFVLAALSWRSAPDTLPVHWGLTGEVDRYGGKAEALLLPPLMALGLYLLLLFAPRLDPGRANYANFRSAYGVIRLAILLVLAGIYVATIGMIWGWQIDMARLVLIVIGALLVLLGSVMGKLRPNWFVGIRTPWTLSSKRAWIKTHRVGGWLFVMLGIVFIAAAFSSSAIVRVVPMGALAATVLALVIYSYIVWRDDDAKTPPAGTLPAERR